MPKRILLIDDNASVRNTLADYLMSSDHVVVTACDGQDGLNAINAATEPFDFVVCDLDMPVMDGWGFLEKRSLGLPVALCTGRILDVKQKSRITKLNGQYLEKGVDLFTKLDAMLAALP